MSKRQITHVRKFLRSDATPLTSEAIDEIRSASKNIPNAERIMCKKHHIGASRYKDIINNWIALEPTDEWRKIINSVCIEPSSHPVSSSPSLEVSECKVKQAEQVVSGWQASGEWEEGTKNISICSGGDSVPKEPAETASEASITFSDASSTSSDKTLPSKKMLLVSQKRKIKAGNSAPSYMAEKNKNDVEKLVNRCNKLVGNETQKTC